MTRSLLRMVTHECLQYQLKSPYFLGRYTELALAGRAPILSPHTFWVATQSSSSQGGPPDLYLMFQRGTEAASIWVTPSEGMGGTRRSCVGLCMLVRQGAFPQAHSQQKSPGLRLQTRPQQNSPSAFCKIVSSKTPRVHFCKLAPSKRCRTRACKFTHFRKLTPSKTPRTHFRKIVCEGW